MFTRPELDARDRPARFRSPRFIYKSKIKESDAREGLVGDLIERMFSGDGSALVNHLTEAG